MSLSFYALVLTCVENTLDIKRATSLSNFSLKFAAKLFVYYKAFILQKHHSHDISHHTRHHFPIAASEASFS